jgi:hypothetical protein
LQDGTDPNAIVGGNQTTSNRERRPRHMETTTTKEGNNSTRSIIANSTAGVDDESGSKNNTDKFGSVAGNGSKNSKSNNSIQAKGNNNSGRKNKNNLKSRGSRMTRMESRTITFRDNNHLQKEAEESVDEVDDVEISSNRETAFMQAMHAAGITHTLTKNCSNGDFADCGCDSRLTRRREYNHEQPVFIKPKYL